MLPLVNSTPEVFPEPQLLHRSAFFEDDEKEEIHMTKISSDFITRWSCCSQSSLLRLWVEWYSASNLQDQLKEENDTWTHSGQVQDEVGEVSTRIR